MAAWQRWTQKSTSTASKTLDAAGPEPAPLAPDSVAGLSAVPLDDAMRDVIRRSDIFAQSGVSIVEVDPPTVRIEVVEIVQRELPILVSVPEGQVDGLPVPSPAVAMRLGRRPSKSSLESDSARS